MGVGVDQGALIQAHPKLAQPHFRRTKRHRSNTPKFAPSHPGKDQPYRNKCIEICPLSLGMRPFDLLQPQPPVPLKKVLQYTSNVYCNAPAIVLCHKEREILSVLLYFVSRYASHLYRNTLLPFVMAMLLGKIVMVGVTGMSDHSLENLKIL